jgi:hypothetical protein
MEQPYAEPERTGAIGTREITYDVDHPIRRARRFWSGK